MYEFEQPSEATLLAQRKQSLERAQKAARKDRRLFNCGTVWSTWSNRRIIKRFIKMPNDQARLNALDDLYARDGKWSPDWWKIFGKPAIYTAGPALEVGVPLTTRNRKAGIKGFLQKFDPAHKNSEPWDFVSGYITTDIVMNRAIMNTFTTDEGRRQALVRQRANPMVQRWAERNKDEYTVVHFGMMQAMQDTTAKLMALADCHSDPLLWGPARGENFWPFCVHVLGDLIHSLPRPTAKTMDFDGSPEVKAWAHVIHTWSGSRLDDLVKDWGSLDLYWKAPSQQFISRSPFADSLTSTVKWGDEAPVTVSVLPPEPGSIAPQIRVFEMYWSVQHLHHYWGRIGDQGRRKLAANRTRLRDAFRELANGQRDNRPLRQALVQAARTIGQGRDMGVELTV